MFILLSRTAIKATASTPMQPAAQDHEHRRLACCHATERHPPQLRTLERDAYRAL